MKIEGRIHTVGDHIDTDQIIPARFLGSSDPAYLRTGCFLNLMPGFPDRVKAGDILVAGENFGCGSSREHAPIAIKGTGIGCVVAKSFSRIYYRSSINIGLPAIICPQAIAAATDGGTAAVDLAAGTVMIDGKSFAFAPFSDEIVAILNAGSLVARMASRLKEQQGAQA